MTKTKPRTEPPEWAMRIAETLGPECEIFYNANIIASSPAVKELVEAAKLVLPKIECGSYGGPLEHRPDKHCCKKGGLQSALKPFRASTGGE